MEDMNILELIDMYIDMGMDEDTAGLCALYDISPEAYSDAMTEDNPY